MLYDILKAVILLSFLFALVLEVIIGYILIRVDIAKHGKSEKKTVKTLNPRKIVRRYKEEKRNEKEMKRYTTLLNNIDIYDGTDFRQKDLE